ncbi:hypothetical protein LJC33_06060 [Eubacteriales bacterium OttesenSCG-928-N13]|nr:hypothetical protein [Eubacteriales bacterium OttesenSCG-928-N13]
MSANMADELKRFMMAGLGAAAVVTEKSINWLDELSKMDVQPVIDNLAKKGSEAYDQGKVIGQELKEKVQSAFEDCSMQMQQMDVDNVKSSMEGMSDEALDALKDHLSQVMADRKQQAEAPAQDAPMGDVRPFPSQEARDDQNEDDPSEAPES